MNFGSNPEQTGQSIRNKSFLKNRGMYFLKEDLKR